MLLGWCCFLPLLCWWCCSPPLSLVGGAAFPSSPLSIFSFLCNLFVFVPVGRFPFHFFIFLVCHLFSTSFVFDPFFMFTFLFICFLCILQFRFTFFFCISIFLICQLLNIVSSFLFRYPASLRFSQTFAVVVRLVRDLESVLRPGRVHTEGPSFLVIVPFKTARAQYTVIHTNIISSW